MTREEAIQFLDNMKHEEAGRAIGKDGFYADLMGYHVQALNMAIKALEHPERNVVAVVPCGDTISRQAVLDELEKWDWQELYLPIHFKENIIDVIPSVNPHKQKTGQYEKHIDHTDCIWYGNDSGCPVTCSQYRDGWNDAMDYIFKNGKGYQPYRHDD